jgi:hypothetical protein
LYSGDVCPHPVRCGVTSQEVWADSSKPVSSDVSREVRECLAVENQDALFADGFDGALIGIIRRYGQESLALYDQGKCLQILMSRDGMSRDEALEYFEFNVIGAWAGDGTPAFAVLLGPGQ